MKAPQAPHFDERSADEFAAELGDRAQAWIPAWGLADSERDFGRALLQIAARFSSEVAERLDRTGEKMRRGLLDWLAVRGKAARAARLPVVFKLADTAQDAVLASAPVQLQADADGTPVVFETEKDVRVVPGRLDVVVGVEADQDALYLSPPGLSDLQPLGPLPTQWRLKSFAAAGATKLQLDPELGLAPGMILSAGGQQYKVVKVDKNIVTIEPPLDTELAESLPVTLVSTFSPFGEGARNRQEHALYLGDSELLNIDAAATIEVVGAIGLHQGYTWEYSGKRSPNEEVSWLPLGFEDNRQKTVTDAIALTKPKGAIELKEVNGQNSRWIRALNKNIVGTESFTTDEFSIRVNASGCSGKLPCPPQGATESPAAEAMANTTPLVLDNVFFPLGKEPRQFDAFYLGSQEAFSKRAAQVQLCFEMADPTFFALSVVRGGVFANAVLAGMAKDQALHLMSVNPTTGGLIKLRERGPLQPPAPGYGGKVESVPAVALDQPFPSPGPAEMRAHWRPPAWAEFDQQLFHQSFSGFVVAVSAGDAIWVWHEHSLDPQRSGWISFGSIPPTEPPATEQNPVAGLVYLAGASPESAKIVALRNGQMAVREWPNGPDWGNLPTNKPVRLESLVPVLNAAAGLTTSVADGMVGVSDDNFLYTVSATGVCEKLPLNDVDSGVRPVAVKSGGKLLIAFAKQSLSELGMWHEGYGEVAIKLEPDARAIGLDAAASTLGLHFLASVLHGNEGYLAWWSPQTDAVTSISYSRAAIPSNLGIPGGAPTVVSNHVVVPGTRGNSFIAELDFTKRFEGKTTLSPGIVLPSSAPPLVPNDLVMRMKVKTNKPEVRIVKGKSFPYEGEVFYPIDKSFTDVIGPLVAYKASVPLKGSRVPKSKNKLNLQKGDQDATVGSFVLINGKLHKVKAVDQSADPWVVTVIGNVATKKVERISKATKPVSYSWPVLTGGHTAPYLSLDAANRDWDVALLKRVPLLFPGAVPEEQPGKAFSTDGAGHPTVVALAKEFTKLPPGILTFVVDATVGEWSQVREDMSANPELSWEYWNGKGWWKLDVTLDETQNLKTTGALQFKVPADIASSDWAGKTNYWIRARLVGGDYGREKVTVKTRDVLGGTEQTVERSSEGIRAPLVLKLDISYRVCNGVQPTFVLAQDSGSFRDQSDANRTAGAIVEAFVPIAVMLGRLSHTATAPLLEQPADCLPECDHGAQFATATVTQTAAAVASAAKSPRLSERALFIGLTARPSEAPVNVLLLVEERQHTAFAPMTIAALVADRFEPIVVDDATRALSESGLLSMAFTIPPSPSDLFGHKGLTWLRLTPKANANDNEKWIPKLRGAYLNAVWAGATETLTRELLGSSDGAPNMSVHLARPPVLDGTLELRVKEPLGEEDRKALLKANAASVKSEVDGLSGDWVLWKQVVDPNDEPADARVYAFDEATGEIRFGDGQHGMIPPIGRDSIIAFKYQRTEPSSSANNTVPGNLVTARTALNLVSPVASVESVTTADQSAGGAPPEDDDRVLRFGYARLRHRDRAITLHDLGDLALQSSPDIVQARAIVRRGSIRLVVVMKGRNPVPTAAQVRELRRLLLASVPVSLSVPNALHIIGPEVRSLRIQLQLRIDTLDHAGDLARNVKEKLANFFDTATGGIDRDGWALGLSPDEDDIAFALLDAPYLDSIEKVTLLEIASDESEKPWPATLKPTELAMLAKDPIRIQFETAEVTI